MKKEVGVMKKFLVLFFVVVAVGMGVTRAFGEGEQPYEPTDPDIGTYHGWVTGLEFNSLEWEYKVHLGKVHNPEVSHENPPDLRKFFTIIPVDSHFIPIIILAFDNKMECEFDARLLPTLDGFDMPENVELLKIRTLDMGDQGNANLDREISELRDMVETRFESLDDRLDMTDANLDEKISDLSNDLSNMVGTRFRSLDNRLGMISANLDRKISDLKNTEQKNFNSLNNKLATQKTLLDTIIVYLKKIYAIVNSRRR